MACLLMLQTLHDDPDVFDMLATAIHGKYMNSKHLAEVEKERQTDKK